MSHYYNEHNAYRAAVLRERMDEGLIPKGVVDERDVQIIPDEDFLGYTQIHLFAGIGGFPLGMRYAGFPEDIRIVTGGFPCQDISNAGKRAGITGARSRLWREMVRCIRVVRPQFVFVENVAALLGLGMGVVLGDLADIGYDAQGDCISAADVGAPHLRRRIFIVANARCGFGNPFGNGQDFGRADSSSSSSKFETVPDAENDGIGRREQFTEGSEGARDVANAKEFSGELWSTARKRQGRLTSSGEIVADSNTERWDGRSGAFAERGGSEFEDSGNMADADLDRLEEIPSNGVLRLETDKGRNSRHIAAGSVPRDEWWKSEPDVGRVAHGIPKRVDRLAALGDAIVPACVEEVIRRLVLGKFYT